MRKLYLLITLAFLAMCTVAKAQVPIYVVTESEGVKYTYYDRNWSYISGTLTPGNATLMECQSYQSISLTNPDGLFFTSVECSEDGSKMPTVSMTSVNFPASAYNTYVPNAIYTVKLGTVDDLRTTSVTVNVDEVGRAKAQRGSTPTNFVELNELSTEVPFYDSSNLSYGEKTFYFDRIQTGARVYAVKKNNENVTANEYNNRFYFNVDDGDVIDVVTKWPAAEHKIEINVPEGCESFISHVLVDGVEVDDWQNLVVTNDVMLEIYGDLENYQLSSSKLDGSNLVFIPKSEEEADGYTGMYVYGAHTYDFNVRAYEKWNVTINVDNSENVIVYNAATPEADKIVEIQSGRNELIFKEQHPEILVMPSSADAYILSVKANLGNTNPDYYSEYGTSSFKVTDDMTVNVTSAGVVRSNEVRVYIDPATTNATASNAAGQKFEIQKGYNTLKFALSDLPLKVKFAPVTAVESEVEVTDPMTLYYATVNGVAIEQTWEGSGEYSLNKLSDGDLVKIYAVQGENHLVNLRIGGELDANQLTLTKDLKDEVVKGENGIEVEHGTRLTIRNLPGHMTFMATANDEPVAADEDGNYSIDVYSDVTFCINGLKNRKYFTIDIDNPQAVTVSGAELKEAETLVAGINAFAVLEENPVISLMAAEGYVIVSFTDGEYEYAQMADEMEVASDMAYTLVTDAITINRKAVVYLHNGVAASMEANLEDNYALAEGYQTIDFSRYHNPFKLTVNGTAYAYCNDAEADEVKGTDTAYELTLRDGDIVKVYAGERPETSNVSFEVYGNPEYVDVMRDLVVAEPYWINGFDVLPGTQVKIGIAEGHQVKVEANNEELTVAKDGTCVLTVNGVTHIVLYIDNTSGVEAVYGTDAAEGCDVYGIDGVLKLRNASKDQLKDLPAGLYIAGGRKIIVL